MATTEINRALAYAHKQNQWIRDWQSAQAAEQAAAKYAELSAKSTFDLTGEERLWCERYHNATTWGR